MDRTKVCMASNDNQDSYRLCATWLPLSEADCDSIFQVKCAAFHRNSSILVVGFSTGLFSLYELPDFNNIHSMKFAPYSLNFSNETILVMELVKLFSLVK